LFAIDRVKTLAAAHPEWKEKQPFKAVLEGDRKSLAAAGSGKRLMALIHHTDQQREWAYDRKLYIGRLDKALDQAREKGWTVVDMKNDWKVVYPFKR